MKISQTNEISSGQVKINDIQNAIATKQQDDCPALNSQASTAGQRRLRTETQPAPNRTQVANATIDQEFIDALMKYRGVGSAIHAKDFHAAELLLEHGVNPSDGSLAEAISIDDIRFAELLLKKYRANPNDNGIFFKAIQENNIQFVDLLLKYKANPNERSSIGSDKLYKYDELGRGKELIIEGMSPLDIATTNRNTPIVISLLKAGADPTLLRKVEFERISEQPLRFRHLPTQASPIYLALKNKDYDLLRSFAQFKADFNKPCFNEFCRDMNPLTLALDMKDSEAVKIFLEGGAKP